MTQQSKRLTSKTHKHKIFAEGLKKTPSQGSMSAEGDENHSEGPDTPRKGKKDEKTDKTAEPKGLVGLVEASDDNKQFTFKGKVETKQGFPSKLLSYP